MNMEIGEVTKQIRLEDISELDPKDVLNPSFIDENILDPLAKWRSETGIHLNVLEERLSHSGRMEGVERESLSLVEGVDMPRELMAKVCKQLLLETNLTLFQQNLGQTRERVYQLLYS